MCTATRGRGNSAWVPWSDCFFDVEMLGGTWSMLYIDRQPFKEAKRGESLAEVWYIGRHNQWATREDWKGLCMIGSHVCIWVSILLSGAYHALNSLPRIIHPSNSVASCAPLMLSAICSSSASCYPVSSDYPQLVGHRAVVHTRRVIHTTL